ncbi:MAG: sodium:proton exchanger [Deltaproteobacteria bacterium RIFCSPLOWO2_12_FULL_60_19]|nr:MAG: sodium:proton exchanger [Deltaproteobacteria bacterium RIFCSPLOWO2_12_FULL_60_19]
MGGLLLALVILLPCAKLAALAAEKLGQPAVMGELIAGVLLGNLGLIGLHGLDYLKTDPALDILASLGVILLLFEVGLESSLADLLKVGLSSFLAGAIGVLLPFGLGWWVSALMLPGHSAYVHSFVGATLCATSVGITARVLQDMGKIRTREAKIILGAAVIDDILGLIVLAIITGIIAGVNSGVSFSSVSVIWLVAKVVIFLIGSLVIGVFFIPRLFRQMAKAKMKGMLFTFSLAFCFLLSYLATLIDLAAIVGAFAAGLILEGVPFEEYLHEDELSPEAMLHPLSAFLVPLFFLQMGIKMDLDSLFRFDVLGLALALTAVALVGKQACGLAVAERGLNRLAIGVGMIPRGEVGLIFAGIGLTLSVGGERMVDEATFAAILVMVMLTTLVSPPLLKWSFSRSRGA